MSFGVTRSSRDGRTNNAATKAICIINAVRIPKRITSAWGRSISGDKVILFQNDEGAWTLLDLLFLYTTRTAVC